MHGPARVVAVSSIEVIAFDTVFEWHLMAIRLMAIRTAFNYK